MRGPISRFPGHALTAAVVVIAALVWGFVQLSLGGLNWFGGGYTVKALVPTSASLTSDARVTMAGVQVGEVTGVERVATGALVTMQLTDGRVTPIPSNSRVAIRDHTPIGENYVEIFPGSSRNTLPSGSVLPMTQADSYVDVDQILSLFQGRTTQQTRNLIDGLGTGLNGRGTELNGVWNGTAGILSNGGTLTDELVGERRQISDLIGQFDALTSAIGQRGDAVRTLAGQARMALGAIAARDNALRSTIDQLPPTLREVRRGSDVIGSVTGHISPVFENLAVTLRDLRPAIAALGPASDQGRALLTQLSSASPVLQTTLGRVRTLAPPAAKALPQLHSVLCQTDPALRYISPYSLEIVETMAGLGSATNSYDGQGHLIRVSPMISDNSLPGLPDAASNAAWTLIHAGLLQKTDGLGYDPYPPPGSLNDLSRGLGVMGPAQVKYKYPRVTADC